MIPLLSRAQMRAFDGHAMDVWKVPSLVLMENAGRGAADVIEREVLGGMAEGARVAILAGAGNNGGDGFVVARHLLARGARVEAWLAFDPAKSLSPEARTNLDAFVALGGKVIQASPELVDNAQVELVVDALFGTGLDRAVEGELAALVHALNASALPVVALDVPSGMNADTGAPLGVAVQADRTVTFGHLKLGHATGAGAMLSGSVHVVDIGVPSRTVARGATPRVECAAELVESADVRALLRPRAIGTHKYQAGHVAIFAGSPGKVGAALLAAEASLRGGAGAATLVTWPDVAASVDGRVVEIMTARLGEGDALAGSIDKLVASKKAVVVGPGFGVGDVARRAVRHLMKTFQGTLVVDADALSLHAADGPNRLEDIAALEGRAILTPHAGELARLLGTTSEAVEQARFVSARTAATRANAVVVLKGPYTVIADPSGRTVVSGSGTPALATAGSGDVLAGLTGALACALPPFEAAYAAAFLHGVVGAAWTKEHGDRGMLASDIAAGLPDVIHALLA